MRQQDGCQWGDFTLAVAVVLSQQLMCHTVAGGFKTGVAPLTICERYGGFISVAGS